MKRGPYSRVRGRNYKEVSIFGVMIRHLRKKKGWTQQDLAKSVGCGQEYIGRLENSTHVPNCRTAKKFAWSLDTSVDTLLGLN